MREGKAFRGFEEAPIDFPPTFKYDVMRTLKRDKSGVGRSSSKRRDKRHRLSPSSHIAEVDEKELAAGTSLDEGSAKGDEPLGKDAGEDAISVISTAVTTNSQSRPATALDFSDDDYFARDLPDPSTGSISNSDGTGFVATAHKVLVSRAAQKAKAKWLSLLSISAPSTPNVFAFGRKPATTSTDIHTSDDSSPEAEESVRNLSRLSMPNGCAESEDLNALPIAEPLPHHKGATSMPDLQLRLTPSKKSGKSAKSAAPILKDGEVTDDEDKGVYDSSSKQRVPSW